MQELIEIVRVIECYGVEDGLLPECMRRDGRESLLQRLYSGIASGRYKRDEDAVQELYGRATVHAAYRQLKSRLRRQLLHAVLGLEIKQPRNTAFLESLYSCANQLTIARALLLLGARKSSIGLLYKALQKAEQMHHFDVVLQCALLLRTHYGLMGLDKQFAKYGRMVESLLLIQSVEEEATRLNDIVVMRYTRSTSKKSEFSEMAYTFVERLQELIKEYPTNTVMLNYFRVKASYCQIVGKFSMLVEVCDEADLYYKKYPHFAAKVRLAEFTLIQMVAFLHLRDYERGELNAQRCMELYPRSNNNWFVFMGYYFLLCLHTQKFVRATEVFQEVREHPRLHSGSEFRLEQWRVYEGYLCYVFESGWETKSNENVDVASKRFNVAKFLNEVPTYSKDKRGMNVSILVLQVLFLVERGEFLKLVEKRETLRRYATRYLLGEDTRRSRVFVKLLLLLEQHNFEYERVERTGRRHYALLSHRDGEYGTPDDAEIIPFELLWERILLRLQRGM